MADYTVITENDESAWDDQTGSLYHFPNRYRHLLVPGTRVLYYKGELKNRSFRSARLSDRPHYFGVGRVSRVYSDPSSSKKDFFATIDEYQAFSDPVLAKQGDEFVEVIPHEKRNNYWRDGVRAISEATWAKALGLASMSQEKPAETLNDRSQGLDSYKEGAARERYVTTYERNPQLRRQAVHIHGTTCFGCGFNFQEKYGQHGEGYIHVHHVNPVASSGEVDVDPARDLIPLCANCHAMVHRKKQVTLTLQELHSLIIDSSQEEVSYDSECIFCNFERDLLAENALAVAVYDAFPVTKGHVLVLPKRHVTDYFDLSSEELTACQRLIADTKSRLKATDQRISGFNVGINSGKSAGQTIDHCHIHLIPRRDGDIANPKGGVRGVIPDKQQY